MSHHSYLHVQESGSAWQRICMGSTMSAATFHIGCAVWGYKDWVGDLFPPGSKAADFLSLYSQRLTTTEGNTTFYGSNLYLLLDTISMQHSRA